MQEVADEMMIQIAKLMPESYRGVYADRIGQPLEFISASA